MEKEIKRGIVLMNLGSPDSTEVKDVRKYLMDFLMDGRVIDYPWIFRKILVGWLIVPSRAPKSAEAYQTIWTKEGSPLIVLTRKLKEAVQAKIPAPVEVAMRYGNPSMQSAFDALLAKIPDLDEVTALPLYPHYAMSSYETAVEHAKAVYAENGYQFRLKFIDPYYDDPGFIDAWVENIRPFLARDHDHILFSYHGIPGRHIRKSDITGSHCLKTPDCCNVPSPAHAHCYRHQVFTTTKLIAEKLGLANDKYSVSFQSRLGKGWLEPFTDIRLKEMPNEGIKKLLVLCPAFVSDCLETLEEIAMRGREDFLEAGGTDYNMIPCLNTHPLWVEAVAGWLKQ